MLPNFGRKDPINQNPGNLGGVALGVIYIPQLELFSSRFVGAAGYHYGHKK